MSTGHGYIIHKDCGKGIIAYEAFGTDAESLGGAYELHTAYISKILKGKENMSLDTLSKLEKALGITLILDEEYENLPIGMVAEDMPPYSR